MFKEIITNFLNNNRLNLSGDVLRILPICNKKLDLQTWNTYNNCVTRFACKQFLRIFVSILCWRLLKKVDSQKEDNTNTLFISIEKVKKRTH